MIRWIYNFARKPRKLILKINTNLLLLLLLALNILDFYISNFLMYYLYLKLVYKACM